MSPNKEGLVAERLGNGLQNRLLRFESGRDLRTKKSITQVVLFFVFLHYPILITLRNQTPLYMHKSILFCALIISGYTAAQAPDYDDLMILYANGNYTELIKSSKSYCKKNETKNDPLPHMWLGRGYFYNSLDGANSEEEQKIYLQKAIDELSNCIKSDTTQQIQEQYFSFFHDFKRILLDVIINEIESEIPTTFWLSEYYKISPESVGARYVEGYYEHFYNNEPCGILLWNEADSLLASGHSPFDSQTVEGKLLSLGVTRTLHFFVENNQPEKALKLVLKMTSYLKEDPDFQLVSESILNKKSQ